MKRAIVVIALAGLVPLVSAANAQADLVLVAKDQSTTGYSLVGNDTSGEANRIEVSFDAATASWLITDEAGVIDAAVECTALSSTSASCLAAPFNIVKLR